MTVGAPFSRMATHEFVVPRSMPITLSIRKRLPSKPPEACLASLPQCLALGGGRPTSGRGAQASNHLFDRIILWGHLCSGLELAPSVEGQPSREVHATQQRAVLRLARLQFAHAL